ncbi:MAG: hypothetical protein M3065_07810 [Actinomycetota bacterium]|nr:hypothetical protein [Actinomycetota bacterium]
MSTIRTTVKRTPTGSDGTVVATVSALIAIAAVALLLSLASGSRGSHAAASHQAPTYYPLIQYRGTGAAPASTAGTHPTTPAPGSPRKS